MIPPLFSHKRHVRSALAYSRRHGGLRTDHRHYHAWQRLKETNLDQAYPLLATLYSDSLGCLGRDPVSMLRSCLAMMLCGVTSFTVWVGMMHDDCFYALISGFHPDDTPGVGTFYDFQDRLLQRPRRPRTTTRRPFQSRDQRDKAQQHRNKNDLRPHKDIVNRLADRILARPFPNIPVAATLEGYSDFSALPTHEQLLHCIFFASFVARSVDLNLIDLDNLHVAGDGTKLATWANVWGKKLCSCDNKAKKAKERCRCLSAYSLQHRCQLPLVVSLADCSRHDSVHCLASIYHAWETFGFFLQTASLDAAHDALGLFRLATQRWHMAFVVPLNERNKDHLRYAGPLRLEKGVPIYQAGLAMKHWGFCHDRLRLKWRCPLAAAKKTPDLTTRPHFAKDCSNSAYGRVIYTYPKENYRFHTLIPRDSDLWDLQRRPLLCRTFRQTQEEGFPSH